MTQEFTERNYQTVSDGEDVSPPIAKRLSGGPINAFLLTQNNDPIVTGYEFARTERAESPSPIQNG